MSNIIRKVFNALLPSGPIWAVKISGFFDKLLDGISANGEIIREYLESLASIRDPYKTILLDDLEKEFGIVPTSDTSDTDRRATVASKKYTRKRNGTAEDLEKALQLAGFDVQVHRNSPAVDPATILDDERNIIVTNIALNDRFVLPSDSEKWGLVFFIGGDVTRDGSGFVTALEDVNIPTTRLSEFYDIVLAIKPMHSWAAMNVFFVGCPLLLADGSTLQTEDGSDILLASCAADYLLVDESGNELVDDTGDNLIAV